MFRPIVALGTIATLCVLFAVPVHAAGAVSSRAAPPEAAVVTGEITDTGPPARPGGQGVYGPISSRDPLARARIKSLYLDQRDLADGIRAELLELSRALRAESDPDFRAEINRKTAQAKMAFEQRNMELGLEIARLNGDERRVAEFELALDQIRHPEKYRTERPASSVRVKRGR